MLFSDVPILDICIGISHFWWYWIGIGYGLNGQYHNQYYTWHHLIVLACIANWNGLLWKNQSPWIMLKNHNKNSLKPCICDCAYMIQCIKDISQNSSNTNVAVQYNISAIIVSLAIMQYKSVLQVSWLIKNWLLLVHYTSMAKYWYQSKIANFHLESIGIGSVVLVHY